MLYSCQKLKELIGSNDCVIVDIRDECDYLEGHIEGAVNIPDIFYFLSESSNDGLQKMKNHFSGLFSSAGITHEKLVIIYEYSLDSQYGGSCRGYWLLSFLGHRNCGILEGGYYSWKSMGLPITKKITEINSSKFIPNVDTSIIASKNEVLEALNDKNIVLLDNRDEEEWIGESSSPYGIDFAPRKGKIPGAIWIEWFNFMNRPGEFPTFKSKEEIVELCSNNNIHRNDKIIIYCFKGARASNTFIALKLAGFKDVSIYFAGWNEWSRDFKLSIEK